MSLYLFVATSHWLICMSFKFKSPCHLFGYQKALLNIFVHEWFIYTVLRFPFTRRELFEKGPIHYMRCNSVMLVRWRLRCCWIVLIALLYWCSKHSLLFIVRWDDVRKYVFYNLGYTIFCSHLNPSLTVPYTDLLLILGLVSLFILLDNLDIW